jgi:NADP-dependent aldehyde dehydrogenase
MTTRMTTEGTCMSVSTETPTGANLVAGADRSQGTEHFHGTDPRTGTPRGIEFTEATPAEVREAASAAREAFEVLATWTGTRRAAMVRRIADALDDAGDSLVACADAESALGEGRLTGELARTTAQLRAFADLVERGEELEAIIDPADPDATPPRPDLRRMLVPIGPVAVFGASNFPLAFSVPGGDTAAALAAGCPVVIKAHPSHPETSERCARLIHEACDAEGAPPGTVSMLHGGASVGSALVTDPDIAAVGFTGSQQAGRALHDAAAARPEPIPVYAEMSSLNPVFVTSAALAARGDAMAEDYLGSMTMGTGQFCTKPGIVFVPDDEHGVAFGDRLAEAARREDPGPLLNARIQQGLDEQLTATRSVDGVEVLAEGSIGDGDGFSAAPTVLRTDVQRFLSEPQLAEEHFGPVTLVVSCGRDDYVAVAQNLEGTLTATIHAEAHDEDLVARLTASLRERAGRIVFNGYPTGVAVTHAMHHGGPYPATTNALHTSVGTTGIRRFLRPVCYQAMPKALIPPPLADDNPLNIRRKVAGTWSTDPLGEPA